MIEEAKVKARWEGIQQLFTKKYLVPTGSFLGAVFGLYFVAKYLMPLLIKRTFDNSLKIISETNISRGLFNKKKPKRSKLPKAIYPDDLQETMDKIIDEDKGRNKKL